MSVKYKVGTKLHDPDNDRFGEIISVNKKRKTIFSSQSEDAYRVRWLIRLDYPVYRTVSASLETLETYEIVEDSNEINVAIKD